MLLQSDLYQAIKQAAVTSVYYQAPQVDMHKWPGGLAGGAGALRIRVRGLISPGEFLPVAQHSFSDFRLTNLRASPGLFTDARDGWMRVTG